MASINSRSAKIHEFMAHNANVNCLALGHKSGRVMVTGGDDKKVNLWAIGKTTCFMSLGGHTTPIECVQFNQLEELVCAGSRAGCLKVWDLEAAKLIRTMNGHKYSIKSIDFHPYGEFLASGSADTSIKLWDTRKKSAISTLNGHKGCVNSIRFSPDGHWIASGGEDATVKMWDIRTGRVIQEFSDHFSAVTCVEFHPHEFLLATGSIDRSVHLFDLENFASVSCEKDLGAVRTLHFNPDGECLFTGVRDFLKVVGWEPSRLYDSVPVNWGRVCDIASSQNQLIGASFHLTNVQVYMVDLKKVRPLGSTSIEAPSSPFTPNQSIRKSFSKAERPVSLKNRSLNVKTIEESTSGTDPEEESIADITNLNDYEEIFKGKGLRRTPPPPEPEVSFDEPEKETFPVIFSDPSMPQILADPVNESIEALSLDNNVNNYHRNPEPPYTPTKYSRSKSNLDQVYQSRLSKQQDRENILPNIAKTKSTPRYAIQRQSSCKDVPEKEKSQRQNNMRHSYSEETNVNRGSMSSRVPSRKNSINRRTSGTTISGPTRIPNINSARTVEKNDRVKPVTYGEPVKAMNYCDPIKTPNYSDTMDDYVNSKGSPVDDISEAEYVPYSVDKPGAIILDDFIPKNHQTMGFSQPYPEMSEAEVINAVMRGHDTISGIMKVRQRSLHLVLTQCKTKDVKTGLETAINMDELSVLVDILRVINNRFSIWSLDLCIPVLSKMQELLQNKYETYMTTGCGSLKLILSHFGNTIRTNVRSGTAGSFGVDISREERYRKCKKCYDYLAELEPIIKRKTTLPSTVGENFRDVYSLLKNVLD